MPRSTLSLLPALVLAMVAAPAAAQFGSIFGLPPPRPPADVPYRDYPVDPRLPVQPRYERQAPEPPPPPLTRLPRRTSPPPGVQNQPLPPPPGAIAAPEPAGRQRQPRGAPQPGAPLPPANDEVVVAPSKQKIVNPTAVFAGLDKITGRIISFDVAIDETVQFGALRLTPRACYTRPPTETPNTDGFIEVDEITLQGEVKRIFTGWMFVASPGLHGIEHPIYDVWLTDCRQDSPQLAGAQPSAQPAAASAEPPDPPAPPAQPQPAQRQPRPGQPAPATPPLRR